MNLETCVLGGAPNSHIFYVRCQQVLVLVFNCNFTTKKVCGISTARTNRKQYRNGRKKTPVESPWNAEEVVQSDAQFFHAGLLKAQRDRQDEAAAPVLSSYRRDI